MKETEKSVADLAIEKALFESERKYRSLFENMLEGYAHCQMLFESGQPHDFIYLDVNPSFERLTGLVGVVGKKVSEVIPHFRETNPEVITIYGRVASTGAAERFETHIDALDVWFEISVYSPGPGHFVAVFDDVTARKQAAEILRKSEERYRASFEGASVGQALTARNGQILEVNKALAITLGYQTAELCNKTFGEITHPDDVAMSIGAMKALLGGDLANHRMEKRYLRKDGTALWVDVNVAAVRDSAGAVTHFVAHVVDISKRRDAEIELGQVRKLEAVGQLASGIAHEINTPIQYVGDSISFLKDAFDGLGKLIPKYRETTRALEGRGAEVAMAKLRKLEHDVDLEYLLANVDAALTRCFDGIGRVSGIVRVMKEFAHPGQLEKSPADINRALESTLIIARNEYKYVANVEVALGDIPLVVCHAGEMNQVFLNLIVNAGHAISEVVGDSGNKGIIRVSTRRDGDAVCIEIADTGPGIPESIRERVFEPFFTTKAVGKGSGQGLAIARSIVVDKHGGALTFETAPGKGTVFRIRLPIERSARAA